MRILAYPIIKEVLLSESEDTVAPSAVTLISKLQSSHALWDTCCDAMTKNVFVGWFVIFHLLAHGPQDNRALPEHASQDVIIFNGHGIVDRMTMGENSFPTTSPLGDVSVSSFPTYPNSSIE